MVHLHALHDTTRNVGLVLTFHLHRLHSMPVQSLPSALLELAVLSQLELGLCSEKGWDKIDGYD